MLSFSTEFPVAEASCTAFLQAVRGWIQGSPHTTLDEAAFNDLPSEGAWSTETDQEKLSALIYAGPNETTAAFRHSKIENDLEWSTVVAFSSDQNDTWVSVRTARESVHPQLGLPSAKKPFVVKGLLAALGGGLDGELFVRDEPYYLNDNDVGMAIRLLNADADNYLPIVYVSRRFDGALDIDPAPLARHLGGMAHVLVEPSRAFSRVLQDGVGSNNVYGGRVGVYWPSGARQAYFLNADTPTDLDVRQLLSGRLRAALLARRPLPRCTWAAAEARVARQAFERLRATGSEDVTDYINIFDAEMRAKARELEDAESEIARLRVQLRTDRASTGSARSSIKIGEEQEAFPGEFSEVAREALQAALTGMDPNGRRTHLISSTLSGLGESVELKTRRERLKGLLRGYRSMTREVAGGLEELGFSISEEGKHYKLKYLDDDRYTFILPKSGSDHRGGLNAVSDIGKRIY